MKKKYKIAITTGEPAGIGPDLCLQLKSNTDTKLVLIGNRKLLEERAHQLGLPFSIADYSNQSAQISLIDCPLEHPVTAGQLDSRNARYVLQTLELASQGCQDGTFDAIVTAPVHKGVINDAGIPFTGHTEFFAEKTQSTPLMLLAAGDFRVALVTTHLPLRNVPDAITEAAITETAEILHQGLIQRFGIKKPNISVCGLNPHAGENGHMGREEIEVIEPTLEKLREKGLNLIGPLPADTAFTPRALEGIDAVLAMYHDQGLCVLKHAGFGEAVNITLGLPIIRTSVDHGTALTLAGTGKAEVGSLNAALHCAIDLVTQKNDT